jgi:four helix bundle protein
MKSKFHFKFEELTIYNRAIDFGEKINLQIQTFPKEEIYRLSSQFIRAADSIALNIAEGSAASPANFNRYLQMAWDSGHECVVCSTKAYLRGFISEEINEENRKDIVELNKMITSYKNYLKKKIKPN